MIIYSPLDGDAITTSVVSKARHCFLMTKLGKPVPADVQKMRKEITAVCTSRKYKVIDATEQVTGRDFLLKIWKQIAAAPIAVGVVHEDIPPITQANIYYELGVAQALGKETVVIKSPGAKVPSDFVRTEYIEFDNDFSDRFSKYLDSALDQANHYELVAEQLDRNPILAIDYLRRAFLITGDGRLRKKASALIQSAGLEKRAANSIELLAAAF